MTAIGIGIGMVFGGNGFSPFAVGSPFLLLDAAIGITLNGADVSDWADQSGVGNDAAQGTPGNQPLFNTSDANFNGQPSITFDGVSEWLGRATLIGGAISQPNTIFIVYKFANIVGVHSLFDGRGASNRHSLTTSGANFFMLAGTSQSIHVPNTDPHILATLFNTTASDSWRDGIQTTPAGTVGTQSLNGLAIGTNQSTGSGFHAGEIAYILAYNAILSDGAKNYIGNGLAGRFGTTWTDI